MISQLAGTEEEEPQKWIRLNGRFSTPRMNIVPFQKKRPIALPDSQNLLTEIQKRRSLGTQNRTAEVAASEIPSVESENHGPWQRVESVEISVCAADSQKTIVRQRRDTDHDLHDHRERQDQADRSDIAVEAGLQLHGHHESLPAILPSCKMSIDTPCITAREPTADDPESKRRHGIDHDRLGGPGDDKRKEDAVATPRLVVVKKESRSDLMVARDSRAPQETRIVISRDGSATAYRSQQAAASAEYVLPEDEESPHSAPMLEHSPPSFAIASKDPHGKLLEIYAAKHATDNMHPVTLQVYNETYFPVRLALVCVACNCDVSSSTMALVEHSLTVVPSRSVPVQQRRHRPRAAAAAATTAGDPDDDQDKFGAHATLVYVTCCAIAYIRITQGWECAAIMGSELDFIRTSRTGYAIVIENIPKSSKTAVAHAQSQTMQSQPQSQPQSAPCTVGLQDTMRVRLVLNATTLGTAPAHTLSTLTSASTSATAPEARSLKERSGGGDATSRPATTIPLRVLVTEEQSSSHHGNEDGWTNTFLHTQQLMHIAPLRAQCKQ
eukprot:ANDGO_04594.mRNA.1 hypothetical protein